MNDKIKSEIIDREMNKFWQFANNALEKYQEREKWICENYNYSNASKAVPDSIQNFANNFLNNLKSMLE